jgi:hypothetical protein
MSDAKAEDLDETRRLLYMAKYVPLTKHYELAGTLINAMRHHQGNSDPQLEDKIVGALNGNGSQTPQWLLDAIESLS